MKQEKRECLSCRAREAMFAVEDCDDEQIKESSLVQELIMLVDKLENFIPPEQLCDFHREELAEMEE
jgi:hypothetical protein